MSIKVNINVVGYCRIYLRFLFLYQMAWTEAKGNIRSPSQCDYCDEQGICRNMRADTPLSFSSKIPQCRRFNEIGDVLVN
jgi:hypothetical protein